MMIVRWCFLFMVCCFVGGVWGESPLPIEDKAQLFIDKLLVRETHQVCFTPHPGTKHPANPLVVADKPWEGWRLEIFGTVLYDEEENLFKMWYVNDQTGWFPRRYDTCYATSPDGIAWDKPLVGTIPSLNGQPHAVVAVVDTVSVFKEPNEPDLNRRYKMIGFVPEPRGYRTLVSPDGLHWTIESENPIAPDADVISAYWDEQRQRYAAYPKIHKLLWRGHGRRVFDVIFSEDFKNWSPPQPAFRPDLRDDAGSLARIERVRPILDRPDDPQLMRTEFYGMGFYSHESCIIAFPWIFTVNNDARYGNQEGPQEIQLAVSHDGVEWERPFRTPIIVPGELGEWDCAYHMTASRAIRVGDEIRLYYSGGNYTHGTPAIYRAEHEGQDSGRGTKYTSSIGLVTWPLDRFVSVDGPQEGGTLTTIPVSFTGNHLVINAKTKRTGTIVVELLDAAGRPLEGMSASDPFTGDELRYTVTFKGKSDLSNWSGKPVSLRFRLKDAELYSFAFRNE